MNTQTNDERIMILEAELRRVEARSGAAYAARLLERQRLEAERDAARADANEMARRFKQAAMMIHEWNHHAGEFSECARQICDENRHALAAHAAVSRKMDK